ncbi:MAG: GNAT family N-acetyltransferase [candidate division WOR-3 bacterium]
MASTLSIISLPDNRWDAFVHQHPDGTIFHTSNWARVIQNTYGYEPSFLVCEVDGIIRAGIPFFLVKNGFGHTRLVCLPFTDECKPLFNTHKDLENDISKLMEMSQEGIVNDIEIRGSNIDLSQKFDFKPYSYYKLFRLNIDCELDVLWKNFKQKSIRYPIKKAQRYGIKIVKSVKSVDMEIFYRLNLLTRRKHGVIPQPYRFFKNILTEIFNQGLGFLLIAQYNRKPIGASIFFTFKNTIYHKFNASDANYLEYQPNHLILWHAIQWAVENGYKTLDLGRTSPDNHGLMAYKKHWGAEEIDLPYYYWPEIKGASATKESSNKYRIASSVLRKMPISILRISGNLLYKYFG